MTISEEIEAIVNSRYNGYKGRANAMLKDIHGLLRKRRGDANFLKYLKELKIKNPRPKLNPSIDISNTNP